MALTEFNYMVRNLAISVDLPWGTSGEAAAVLVDAEGNAKWEYRTYPDGLLRLLSDHSNGLVLLDIPICGLDKLVGKHFRPVDNALLRVGIPVRPSTSAQGHGMELADSITDKTGVRHDDVYEIYPYATYKVLDYLTNKVSLHLLDGARVEALDDTFIGHYPLPYKRNSSRGTHREGISALYSVLAQPWVGLTFERPLPTPGDGRYNLKRLSDIYDAALGAVLGLHMLRGSPWALVKGDANSGNMALLVDEWLSKAINRHLANAARSTPWALSNTPSK